MNDPSMAAPQPLFANNLLHRAGLVHGFSTRAGGTSACYRPGDLNLGHTAHDRPEAVVQNRRRFLRAVGAEHFRSFALMRQRHTTTLHRLRSASEGAADIAQPGTLEADAVMTDVPGLLLTVQTADCMPVLLFDPVRRAAAAFHAGWRGTVGRIVQTGVAAMAAAYGSDPADMLAAIGPGIGPASYTVGEDLRSAFCAAFPYGGELFEERDYALFLDLPEANRRQLLDAGLLTANLCVLAEDTAADTGRFFSYRAEAGRTGRMMSVIGMLPERPPHQP